MIPTVQSYNKGKLWGMILTFLAPTLITPFILIFITVLFVLFHSTTRIAFLYGMWFGVGKALCIWIVLFFIVAVPVLVYLACRA